MCHLEVLNQNDFFVKPDFDSTIKFRFSSSNGQIIFGLIKDLKEAAKVISTGPTEL